MSENSYKWCVCMSERGGERVDALYICAMRKVEWDQMNGD